MIAKRDASLRSAVPFAGALAVAVIAFALHPHISGHSTPRTELEQLVTLSPRDRLVHGTLLFLLGSLLTGFTRYALRRGLTRQPVVIGLVTFAVGIGGLIAATLIDGFIFPEIAARFLVAPAAQEAAIAILSACSVAVYVLTAFGMLFTAIAISAWSFDLARDAGNNRIVGIIGFVSAAMTLAALIRSGPFLKPAALMMVLCAQGVWYVWIGCRFRVDADSLSSDSPTAAIVAVI